MSIRAISLFVVALQLISTSSSAKASGTRPQKRAVAPANSAVPDFILRMTSNYCDTALPYVYKDGPNPSLQLWPRQQVDGVIFSKYGAVYDAIGAEFYMSETDPDLKSGLANKVDVPIAWSNTPLTITDPGDSILGQAELELGPEGYDAARLLVRTLQPSLVANACNPGADDFNPKSTTGISEPVQPGNSPFSFTEAAYYLIDVVRWETVKGNGGSTNQVASDHWYLFNFSDAKASHRKAPFTFHPFVTSDLRIFGSAKHPNKTNVVFLAIHLAPQGSKTDTSPGLDAQSKTAKYVYQQKWFDTVDISYKLHADKVVPANIQDLGLLLNLVTGITLPQNANGVPAKPEQPENQPKLTPDCQELSNKEATLGQTLRAAILSGTISPEDIDAITSITTPSSCTDKAMTKTLDEILAWQTTNAEALKVTTDAKTKQRVAVQPDLARAAFVSLYYSIVSPPPTFQGRYGAGLVTNLRDLPAQLTSSMTANFSGVPDQPASPYCAHVEKSLSPSTGTKDPQPCAGSSAIANSIYLKPPNAFSPISQAMGVNYDPSDFPASDSPQSSHEARLVLTDYGQSLPSQKGEEATHATGKPPSPKKLPAGNGAQSKTDSKPTTAPAANCDSSTTTDPATKKTAQKPCTLTQSIIDEGLYHWDVSIAVPTPGYKESVFDSNNALMPKSVTQTNAYAMLDIAPWGEDFVKPQLFGIPHLMTGLPISGQVFDKPFVGGLGEEVGLTKLLPLSARIFAGVVYIKEFRGAAQDPHRVWKVQYGIELSMRSAISKLKGSTAKTNSTTAGN